MSGFKRAMKIGCGGTLGLGALILAVAGPCWTSWAFDGILVQSCPAGDPRPVASISTYGLERDRAGTIDVEVQASYFDKRWRGESRTSLRRFDASAFLKVGDTLLPVACEEWDSWTAGQLQCAEARLPGDVPDGDHTLVVRVETPLEEDAEVEVDLPLYVPAALHVLTDRPLYEPGQTMLFRAISLRRSDLTPIDDRPGVWEVLDPGGRVLLEERSGGGEWGVTDSSFPLAADAEVGRWTVRWTSGPEVMEVQVDVRPFTLPRFSVDAATTERWYTHGDTPAIEGSATYASGAPVSDAQVEVRWSAEGNWPPPNDWLETKNLTTDARGEFTLTLPEVPTDLPGAETTGLTAMIAVTDEGGEVIYSAARVLLSKDPLIVDGVTEISDGLVGGYSNRAYLRVTTPDGQAVPASEVIVRRKWDPRDVGEQSTSDEDGVIALQLDPGEPVNVIIPAAPWRPPPPSTTRTFRPAGASQLLAGTSAGIAEARAMDALSDRMEARCAHLVTNTTTLEQVVRVRGARVIDVQPSDALLTGCMADAVAGAPFDGIGLYTLRWSTQAPQLPTLSLNNKVSAPGNVSSALNAAALEARACLADLTARYQDRARGSSYLGTAWSAIWSTREGSRQLAVELHDAAGDLPGADCVAASLRGLTLDAPAGRSGLGATALSLSVPVPAGATRSQPTVRQGYEFSVAVDGIGETTWRAWPGAIPAVRLRPSQVLVDAGEPFEVEILRGPDFSGELPRWLTLKRGVDTVQEVDLGEEPEDRERLVKFTPPADAAGFLSVEWSGARALVYAAPPGTLELSLSFERDAYKPGETAQLNVSASGQAVVSLVGVDSRLNQLAPLAGPDDLGEVLVPASSADPAFGRFDAVALAMGSVRGENAARAAVARVSELSPVSALSPYQSFYGSQLYDPEEELAEAFYGLLPFVRQAVKDWEASAPEGELLTNERMAALFEDGLKASGAAGQPVRDPWGNRVSLARLPEPMLERLDPRVMTGDGTRLPEDIINWTRWATSEGS